MDRIWLRQYPPGVPAQIDPSRYASLVALLDQSFRLYAARGACTCMGKTITYAELDDASRALAAWLQARGLPHGTRVAVMMPNVLQNPVAIAAILRAGMTVVNVNPLYKPRELEHQLSDSGAEAIVVLENFASVLQEALPHTKVKHVLVASMGDMLGGLKGTIVNFVVRRVKKLVPAYALPNSISFNAALAEGGKLPFNPPKIGPDDIAFLQYTGGTTGVAKGAMLLHRNMIANLLQLEAWNAPMVNRPPATEQLIVLTALPLYHIFALTACFLFSVSNGGLCILIPNPRDIGGLIKVLKKTKVNFFPAVNTLYNGLLNHSDFASLDFAGLKVCPGGGMAVQKAVADKWLAVTGVPIVEGYGLSETSPVVAANRCDIKEFTGTIGFALPSTELRIIDEADNEVPFGTAGEIAVRGPQVMAGYWQRPDETAKVMTLDGFFKTGDIGVMNASGAVKIVDRKKDMILVSGFNVYPNEVEDVVAAHPGVLEVACVGVPDQHSGEAVKLYVVRKDKSLSKEDVLAYCKEQLTGYKRPKYVEFRDSLPKTNVGKILRRELRDEKQTA